MTTKRQIKKLLQPIADRHDDLVYLDCGIVLKPLRHVVRIIWIDRCGTADLFRPHSLVAHMFSYNGNLSGADSYMYPIDKNIHWQHDDPSVAQELLKVIETMTLPFLRRMENLEEFLEQTRIPPPYGPSYFGGFAYRDFLREVGAGEFDAAMKLYGKGIDMSGWVSPRDKPWLKQHYAEVQVAIDRLAPLVAAGDRSGVGDVLREMERVTARKLRMEHFWEPTPFSFETNDCAV